MNVEGDFNQLIYRDMDEIALSYKIDRLKLNTKAGGFSTNNYVAIADDMKIFIKQYVNSDENKIKAISEQTLRLCNAGVLTPMIRLNIRKEARTKVHNSTYVVYPYVEGDVLHGSDFTKHSLRSVALNLAKLHNTILDPKLCLLKTNERLLSVKQVAQNAKNLISQCNKEIIITSVKNKLSYLYETPLESLRDLKTDTLIHGDFHNENIIIGKDFNVAAIVDFEMLHYGDHIEDVINFIQFAFCNTKPALFDYDNANYFLKSYEEQQGVHFSQDYVALGIKFYLYRMCSSFFFEELFLKTQDEFLLNLIERDVNKLDFLKANTYKFIDELVK